MPDDPASPRPPTPVAFTAAGFRLGMRMAVPILPGLVAFALAFGTASAARGLTLWQSLGMSTFVSAGASQMLSLEIWREGWTVAGIVTVAVVTAAVNARFLLQGASLQPWLRGTPPALQAVSLFWLFDASWLIAERDRAAGGRDVGVFLGAGCLCWAVWAAATAPGFLLGAAIPHPERFGLDLVLPIFFAAMVVPLWRGWRGSGLPWAVAAGSAVLWQALVPGYLFIVVGALAGALAGALTRD